MASAPTPGQAVRAAYEKLTGSKTSEAERWEAAAKAGADQLAAMAMQQRDNARAERDELLRERDRLREHLARVVDETPFELRCDADDAFLDEHRQRTGALP